MSDEGVEDARAAQPSEPAERVERQRTREEATHPRAVSMACPAYCSGGVGGSYAKPGETCPSCGGRGEVMADPPDAVPDWLGRKERGEAFDEVADRARPSAEPEE